MTTEQWHLSKTVPVSIILALLIQGGSFVWWASSINFKVENISSTLEVMKVDSNTENNLQWSRINTNGDGINNIQSSNRTLAAILTRVESDVKEIEKAQKETNELIRDILRKEGK